MRPVPAYAEPVVAEPESGWWVVEWAQETLADAGWQVEGTGGRVAARRGDVTVELPQEWLDELARCDERFDLLFVVRAFARRAGR